MTSLLRSLLASPWVTLLAKFHGILHFEIEYLLANGKWCRMLPIRQSFSAASAEYASCCQRGWTSAYRTRLSVAIHPSTGRPATPTGRWSTVFVVSLSDSSKPDCMFSHQNYLWAFSLAISAHNLELNPFSNYLPKKSKDWSIEYCLSTINAQRSQSLMMTFIISCLTWMGQVN